MQFNKYILGYILAILVLSNSKAEMPLLISVEPKPISFSVSTLTSLKPTVAMSYVPGIGGKISSDIGLSVITEVPMIELTINKLALEAGPTYSTLTIQNKTDNAIGFAISSGIAPTKCGFISHTFLLIGIAWDLNRSLEIYQCGIGIGF